MIIEDRETAEFHLARGTPVLNQCLVEMKIIKMKKIHVVVSHCGTDCEAGMEGILLRLLKVD